MIDIESVKTQVNIEDVVGEYVKLNSAYKGSCPFHSPDKKASFSVRTRGEYKGEYTDGFFKCFTCHAHGDVFDFVQKIENVDLPEAVKIVCQTTGIKYSNTPMYTEEERKCIETLRSRNIRYTNELLGNEEILDYLYDRGLDETDVRKWRLGVVPDDEYKRRKEDYLIGRISFPIMVGKNENSYCIGMAYRSLEKETSYKYISDSIDKVVSFKGKVHYLYGLNYAKTSAKKKGSVIITEGYMDVIAMHKCGFTNTVASMGIELAQTQIDLLKPLVNKVYLFWDGDKYGIEAVDKAVLSLIQNGLEVFVISIKDGKDPADLCFDFGFDKRKMSQYISKHYSIGLKDIINKRLSSFEDNLLSLQADTYKKVNEIISLIPDDSVREVYTSMVRKRLL